MPFGLTGAPAAFCHLINAVFSDMIGDSCQSYVDDILVLSSSFEAHLQDVRRALQCLRKANLTINLKKSKFGDTEATFLGHEVTATGLRPGVEKTRALLAMPAPTNRKQLAAFLGLANWFARFIPDLQRTAAPLQAVRSPKVPFFWTPEQDEAFRAIKQALASAPVLQRPVPGAQLKIQVDASEVGMGAVLLQRVSQDAEWLPVAFHSRRFSRTQAHYSAIERECLGIVMAVEKFQLYIDGVPFTLDTDHAPLQWLRSLKSPSAKLQRWALRLQEFQFSVSHIPGVTNLAADCLSRLPVDPPIQDPDIPGVAPVLAAPPPLSADQIRAAQARDGALAPIIQSLRDAEPPESTAEASPYSGLYELQDGMLVISCPSIDATDPDHPWKIVIPSALIERTIQQYHDSPHGGHFGQAKTLSTLRDRVWWPSMARDIIAYVRACHTCQTSKPSHQGPVGPLRPLRLPAPMVEVAVDLLGPLPTTEGGNRFVLVATDIGTRWVMAFPLVDSSAPTIASTLQRHWLDVFGRPRTIVSDNAAVFTGHAWSEFLAVNGIVGRTLSPYNPRANIVERFNKTIVERLRAFCSSNQTSWDTMLSPLCAAIRSAEHAEMRVSSAQLLLGYAPLLPGDFLWRPGSPLLTRAKAAEWRQALDGERLRRLAAWEEAREGLMKAQDRNTALFNPRRRDVVFAVGDWVYATTHILSDGTRHTSKKLSPVFEGPFRITAIRSPDTVDLQLVYAPYTTRSKRHISQLKKAFLPWSLSHDHPSLSHTPAAIPDVHAPTAPRLHPHVYPLARAPLSDALVVPAPAQDPPSSSPSPLPSPTIPESSPSPSNSPPPAASFSSQVSQPSGRRSGRVRRPPSRFTPDPSPTQSASSSSDSAVTPVHVAQVQAVARPRPPLPPSH